MLVSAALVKSFNEQIGHEMGASMQYTAIASYFGTEGLPELQKHFERQSAEERVHALKFVKFLVDAGGRVEIPAIPAPRSDFKTAEEAVALSLAWEETVTRQIYGLVDAAKADNNYIAIRFLDWFVTEQLEEVSSMAQLLSIVQRAGDDNLLFVENYLVRRTPEAGAPDAD
jgi:ferritin